jgi:anti-sigma factor RsiW
MNCRRCEELLSALVDGALTPNEIALVEAHLGACSGCAAKRDELMALKRLLGEVDTPQPEPEFWRETFADLAPATSRRREKRQLIRLRVAEAAIAAAVLGLVIARIPSPDTSPVREETPVRIQVASFDPASLVSLHATARAARPLADTGKIRFAISESDSRDYANDNALDSL